MSGDTALASVSARLLARTYDRAFAGSGMNVTQFAVMRAVERRENEPLSRVADDLAMERTSLYGPWHRWKEVTG